MSERRWTDAQKAAITSKAPDLLVSAAAGSGKTAVLTKRIIDKLTDPVAPADISRLLIVTFTKAAAGELKERIRKAIVEAMAKYPSNKHLQKQYVRLSGAKIQTIHGFCYDLIRQNSDLLGLSPSVRISDEVQSTLIKKEAADTVIENYYTALPNYDDIPDFVTFADNFISLHDDKLSEILLSLYEKVSSFPDGISFLHTSAIELAEGAVGTITEIPVIAELFEHYLSVLSYYRELLTRACDEFELDELFSVKYLPTFTAERIRADALIDAMTERDYVKVQEVLTSERFAPPKLGSIKKEQQTKRSLFYKDEVRESFRDFIKELSTVFSDPLTVHQKAAEKSAQYVENLYRFLSAFERKYTAEKRQRSLLDYTDLERLAHRLLVKEDGSPSEVARQLSSAYDEIYIDEYQDVNRLQDDIFSAIAARSDRFMVGDIKQSIYAFRGAEPSLFADYRRNDNVEKVYLSHNFRSAASILSFVNTVCGALFSEFGKTVPYAEEDALLCGREDIPTYPVELDLLNTGKMHASERRAAEASHVADRVASLLNEGVAPKDIAILLRATSRSAAVYEEAFAARGIPCRNRVTKDLFMNPEVLLVINLLNVIDNPSRDIYLAGALKSPLFHFSLQELIDIRRYRADGSLYDALRTYTEETGFEKGQYALSKLSDYRTRASLPVNELLWHIYCDAKLFALASGDGESAAEKKANLMLLYDIARRFESGTFKGLYHFIRYINDMLASGATMPSAAREDGDNAVRLMTIHQSKGLEFPVVFLADLASDFNTRDKNESVIIDKDLGVSLKLSDPTGLATVDTIFRRAAGIGITNKSIEEEIRVLYVALTRPKERLILTAALPDPDKRRDECEMLREYRGSATADLYRQRKCFLDWILLTADPSLQISVISAQNADEGLIEPSDEPVPAETPTTPTYDEAKVATLVTEFTQRFSYTYPTPYLATLPAKLSVSELYPEILDDADDALRLSSQRENRMRRPRFAAKESSSAADRGTATHQFMQFCDLKKLTAKTVDEELERLTHARFLDAHTASLVNKEQIRTLLDSPLYRELIEADDLQRELRFNIRLPANAFSHEEERQEELTEASLLVQGIMDGVFTDKEGRLTILDYKTDRIPHGMSRTEAEAMLITRHRQQLSYYRAACERMMCRPVERILLYSFSLGDAIEIPLASLISL